jgi:hypothetical protein
MRNEFSRRGFCALLGGVPAFAQSEESGFTPLFDGRTLNGWTIEAGPDSAYFAQDGALVVSPHTSFPTWLRSAREYENFDFRCEFFVKGWTDSGIYLHAPEHGRPTWAGMQIKIFHQPEERPTPQSVGAILPVVAPAKINVRPEWNTLRAVCQWPKLQVWINGDEVQSLDLERTPELRHRLRRGYFGIASASAACRFRNLRVRELPGALAWQTLYEQPSDLANWLVTEGQPNFTTHGAVLRSEALGHLGTKEKFRDFELQMYVRGASQHNGGVIFRGPGRGVRGGKDYEIQLHSAEEAHFPTGSLYHYQRATYPRIEDEKWYLLQLLVHERRCLVRINGDTVLDHNQLEILTEGLIELQAHRRGYWTEFKHIKIRRIDAI